MESTLAKEQKQTQRRITLRYFLINNWMKVHKKVEHHVAAVGQARKENEKYGKSFSRFTAQKKRSKVKWRKMFMISLRICKGAFEALNMGFWNDVNVLCARSALASFIQVFHGKYKKVKVFSMDFFTQRMTTFVPCSAYPTKLIWDFFPLN